MLSRQRCELGRSTLQGALLRVRHVRPSAKVWSKAKHAKVSKNRVGHLGTVRAIRSACQCMQLRCSSQTKVLAHPGGCTVHTACNDHLFFFLKQSQLSNSLCVSETVS